MKKLATLTGAIALAITGTAYAEKRDLAEDLRKQRDLVSFVNLPQNYQRKSVLDMTPAGEYLPTRMTFTDFSLALYNREYHSAIKTEQTTDSIVIEGFWSDAKTEAAKSMLMDYVKYTAAEKRHAGHPHVELLRAGDAYLVVDNIPNGSRIIEYQRGNPPKPVWKLSEEDKDNGKAMDNIVTQFQAVYGLEKVKE